MRMQRCSRQAQILPDVTKGHQTKDIVVMQPEEGLDKVTVIRFESLFSILESWQFPKVLCCFAKDVKCSSEILIFRERPKIPLDLEIVEKRSNKVGEGIQFHLLQGRGM